MTVSNPYPYNRIEGFRWAVIEAFRDPLSKCSFEIGDTFYSTGNGYDPGALGPNVQMIMVKQFGGLHVSSAPQEPEEDETTDERQRLAEFRKNWEDIVEISLWDGAKQPKPIQTTKGKLFSVLLKGDLEILSDRFPLPPVPKLYDDAFQILRVSKNKKRPYYSRNYEKLLSDPLVSEGFSRVSEKVIEKLSFSTKSNGHYSTVFFFPVDLLFDQTITKQDIISKALQNNFAVTQNTFGLAEIAFPYHEHYLPTLRLVAFSIATSNVDDINKCLKSVLYKPAQGAEVKQERFSLDKHGFLV